MVSIDVMYPLVETIIASRKTQHRSATLIRSKTRQKGHRQSNELSYPISDKALTYHAWLEVVVKSLKG
jgi:hypothetical protein